MLSEDELTRRFAMQNLSPEMQASDNITTNDICAAFLQFAEHLNEIVPDLNARAKAVMFTELESAQMWAEKATRTSF